MKGVFHPQTYFMPDRVFSRTPREATHELVKDALTP